MGAPGLKVSYKVALLKGQEKGFPAEGGFLQGAASKESCSSGHRREGPDDDERSCAFRSVQFSGI